MNEADAFSKRVEQEVRRAMLNITGHDPAVRSHFGNAQTGFRAEQARLRSIPHPQIYPDGGAGQQTTTVVTIIGPDPTTGAWTWQVDEMEIFGSYSRANDITGMVTNYGTPIALSHTSDDLLYGEITWDTGTPTNFPTATGITFKAAGSASLPNNLNLIYANIGASPDVNNFNITTRFTIASSVLNTVPTPNVPMVLQCITGSAWVAVVLSDSEVVGGGSDRKVNTAIVIGGGGP